MSTKQNAINVALLGELEDFREFVEFQMGIEEFRVFIEKFEEWQGERDNKEKGKTE